jgi:cellulose synthase/poly-beta-1,6-N-acetylglucosamine synthase-like glycosyltransferase
MSMGLWDWFAWTLCAVWFLNVLPMWIGMLQGKPIDQFASISLDDPQLPFISIIVPARDEAAAVGDALRRMLAIDYPRYEVIAIDDRSTDGTAEIMDRAAGDDPRCRVLHIRELPAGWLGKNHANMQGARLARGDWLLFTDGDVMFEPGILRHAVAAVRENQLDHLVLLPDSMTNGLGESMLMTYFAFLFTIFTQFPLARFRWIKTAYIGVGAFNLVRRTAYESVGGHERLRLEVADDLVLGKLIKHAEFRQRALIGIPQVRLKWQTGLMGIVRGLEKNAFAGMGFSLARTVLALLLHAIVMLGPITMVIAGPGRLPGGLTAAMTLASLVRVARVNRYGLAGSLAYPLAAVLFTYIVLRSMFVTLRRGGVTWRGTFYPLDELRRGRVS